MESVQNSQELPQISRQGETSRSPRSVDRRGMSSQNSIIFREIHKNAWLKKLPPADKKSGAGVKKGERVWVVFCVHDDAEAFLEIYPDQRVAGAHRPERSFSLGGCRHVSPTICAQGDEGEFEFVITLPSDHVRLIAPTWDVMMEWVETIQAKLREMKILSPKENFYSRMPEGRSPAGPLAPTRDPNSPLPPRPNGPTAATAGLESQPAPSSATPVTQEDREEENVFFPEVTPRNDSVVLRNSSTTSLYITQSEPPVYSRPHRTICRTSSTPGTETVDTNTSVPSTPNITIIEVSSTSRDNMQPSTAPCVPFISDSGSTVIFNFSQMDDALQASGGNTEARMTSPISSAMDQSTRPIGSNNNISQVISDPSESTTSVEVPGYASPSPSRPSILNSFSRVLTRQPSIPRSQFYDVPEGREDVRIVESQEVSPAISRSQFYDLPEGRDDIRIEGPSEVVLVGQEVVQEEERSLYERVYVPVSLPSIPPPLPLHERANVSLTRRRSAREVGEGVGNGIRTATEESLHSRLAGDVISRGSQSATVEQGGNSSERRLLPPPQPYRQNIPEANSVPGGGGVRLTLREQQVRQLRKEMSHPGGVRLQLRRKDCVGSIALVDALGSVWVAGWKQRERPMLYNVLHFGDQLLSVCGVRVQSAVDAQRLIRGASGLYVELLIRRLPYGRVYAVQRDTPVESGSANSVEGLGLMLEGGTAEVRTVEPGGPAARAGLPPRAPTADGLSICPWVLTEVNSRPLNPFFRDGEPAMRLGAVGGEVSLLVQPSDLARRLRKQLKALRSYKDYIVQ